MANNSKHFRCNRRCDWLKETRSGYKPTTYQKMDTYGESTISYTLTVSC
ncbi:C1q and tumor necrosis factor-related protein 3-like protein [Daphnia magna]|uniref:C1q and tumor necrosis factor-related protein 3-like protein n=1 Tax=Daphnia magna TaxID=35525 RepID=A0A164FEF0_9CRUS|nr:C1q and tumor necrosis factor-related protein 3-like protein [Daphnia magna]